jgi:hypothetical protein
MNLGALVYFRNEILPNIRAMARLLFLGARLDRPHAISLMKGRGKRGRLALVGRRKDVLCFD